MRFRSDKAERTAGEENGVKQKVLFQTPIGMKKETPPFIPMISYHGRRRVTSVFSFLPQARPPGGAYEKPPVRKGPEAAGQKLHSITRRVAISKGRKVRGASFPVQR